MSKGKRAAISLRWAFGTIIIVFTLFTGSVTYSAEIDDVRAAIRATGATWEAAENPISMRSAEERVRLLGVLPGEEPFVGEEIYPGKEGLVSIPSKVDWRNNGGNYVSSVKDQGGCGSCWAFAVTGALESKAMISLGTPGRNLNLSEQIVLSCSGAGSCGGGYIDQASSFLFNYGDAKEGCYPYTSYYGSNGNCANACTSRMYRPYRLENSWAWVATNADAMKAAIADYGPIVTTLAVYEDFYYYGGGIYRHTWGDYSGLHAVLAVGYNDNNGGYFIVKNSWGPYWGEGGYFKIYYSEVSAQRFGWGYCNGNPPYPCGAGTIYYPSGVLPVAVTLTSPNGGEPLESGGTFNITWDPPYNPGTYDLWYSLNNGLTWKPIDQGQGVTGTNYLWDVPVLPKNKSKCLIGIEDYYNDKKMSEDISSAPFKIDVVALTSPNGGDLVPSGGSWPITWTTNGTTTPVDSVKLTYTLDNGLTWKPITTLTGGENPGTHSWSVQTVKTDKMKCKVKVVLKDATGKIVGSDMSDSTFTISPNL